MQRQRHHAQRITCTSATPPGCACRVCSGADGPTLLPLPPHLPARDGQRLEAGARAHHGPQPLQAHTAAAPLQREAAQRGRRRCQALQPAVGDALAAPEPAGPSRVRGEKGRVEVVGDGVEWCWLAQARRQEMQGGAAERGKQRMNDTLL